MPLTKREVFSGQPDDRSPAPQVILKTDRSVSRARWLLRISFSAIPIIAGIDKYFHLLTNWDQYLSPYVMMALGPRGTHLFMSVDGAIEILLGIGVALKPRVFAFVVALWLFGIVLNLLTTGHYFDIILRDLGLSLSALALGVLSTAQ